MHEKQIGQKIDRAASAVASRFSFLVRTGQMTLPKRTAWTSQKDKGLRELWAAGKSPAEIGEQLTRSTSAVSAQAGKLGLAKRTELGWDDPATNALIELWEGSTELNDIARQLGRTVSAVTTHARRICLGPRPRASNARLGELRPWTPETAIVAERWGQYITLEQIGKELGRTAFSVQSMASKLCLPRRSAGPNQGGRAKYSAGVAGMKLQDCLRCERKFTSEGAHNRMCDPCREVVSGMDW